jgi:hypothetical protein
MTGAAAGADTNSYVDLSAGLGFSSNPFLNIQSRSAAFGRISANGVHAWNSETGTTSLTGYVENTTYFRDYGSKQIFDLGAHTRQRVSENVTIFGDVGLAGDFAGQLSNRLLSVPTQPIPTEPENPLPSSTNNPDLFGFSGRQYRVNGQVGASIRSGARGTISLSAGAQRTWFTGGNSDADYNAFFGSAGYSQQISERTTAGVAFNFQRQDYRHGDWANIVNPVLTLHSQLSESLTGDASVGVMVIEQSTDGRKERQVSPSFSGSLCNRGEVSQLCAHVSRDAQTALGARVGNGTGEPTITTSAGLDYYRRLSANGTLQLALSGVRYDSPSSFDSGRLRTTYLSGVAGYDRKIHDRFFAGVSGGVRKLFQVGTDPDLDLNANVYLRYRLGDIQ